MAKSKIRIDTITTEGKTYYKSIVLPISALKVWKALNAGLRTEQIDLNKLRAERKRKGGR